MRQLRKWTESVIEGLSSGGAFVAAVMAVVVGVILVMSVIAREFFHYGFTGALEIPQYMMSTIIFLGVAGAFRAGALIVVSVLTDKLSPRVAARIRVLTLVLAFLVAAIFTWQLGDLTWDSWVLKRRETSGIGTPLWVPQIAMFLGALFLSLQILLILVRKARGLSKVGAKKVKEAVQS